MAQPRVLLVDDDPDFRDFVKAVAQENALELLCAQDLQSGRAAASQHEIRGFLIDGYLPDGSGIELGASLRARHGDRVVLGFISAGYARAEDFRYLTEECGFDYVLSKPVAKSQLLDFFRAVAPGPIDDDDDDEAFMADLKEQYRNSICTKLHDLEGLLSSLRDQLDPESLKALGDKVHRIAGSAGSYGFDAVSELCRQLDEDIRGLRAANALPDAVWLDRLPSFFRAVKHAFQFATPAKETGQILTPYLDVFYVDDDHQLLAGVEQLARSRGLTVQTCSDPAKARRLFSDPGFETKVLLVDLHFDGSPINGYTLIRDFRAAHPDSQTSLNLITVSGNTAQRIQAVQHGVEVFFQKPVSIAALVESCLAQVAEQKAWSPRVLVVGADMATPLLKQLDLDVVVLAEEHLLTALANERADAVVLGLTSNAESGLAALQVLKSDYQFRTTPTVAVVPQSDPALCERAFWLGADECVGSPIEPVLFRSRLSNLLRRGRQVRYSTERDSLTGLLNRRAFRERFQIALARATRRAEPLSLAFLDFDHFKHINDTRGHAVGDRVLVEFANYLRRSLRRSDFVGRWGGDELVVALENVDAEHARFVLGALLQELRATPLAGESRVRASFSAGVSSFPLHGGTLEALGEVADAALYRAKEEGRARVIAATAGTLGVLLVEDDPSLGEMLARAFEQRGFWVELATTLAEARSFLISRRAIDVRLAVLDRILPDGDGLSLLAAESPLAQQIPTIILTVRGSKEDAAQGLRAGACDYLSKPFRLSEFMESALRLLAMRAGSAEEPPRERPSARFGGAHLHASGLSNSG